MERSKVFLDVCTLITSHEEVPYYLESKIIDLVHMLEPSEISEILHYIMRHEGAAHIFRYLNRKQVLKTMAPYLHNLASVPQRKGRAKNAFEHTMNVIEAVPTDDIDLRWVALLHDIGKYHSYLEDGDFKSHAKYSWQHARAFVMALSVANPDKIVTIVKNHMFPLDYQRNPNWTDRAVDTFIERCGKEYAIPTIQFSIYDKKAENNVPEFLAPLYDLWKRVSERTNSAGQTSNGA